MPEYRVIFYMPVVAPPTLDLTQGAFEGPPPFTDPDIDYVALTNAQAVVAVVSSNQCLKVSLSDGAKNVVLSMTGGSVSYVPRGKGFTLPDGTELRINNQAVSTGAGSIVIEVWIVDCWTLMNDLPSGVQPAAYILYHNIKEASVRAALEPHVKEMSSRLLAAGSALDFTTAPRSLLESEFLDRLILGQNSVFLPGGTVLGEANTPVSGTGSNAEITLQFLDADECALSPIQHIREMPNFGGSHWNGHPLIAALASLSVAEDPSALDLFAVGHSNYSGASTTLDGDSYLVQGTVYYPADSEGEGTPFNSAASPAPIVFMAHGNHATAYATDHSERSFKVPIRFSSPPSSGWVQPPGSAGWVPSGLVELPSHGGWAPAGWVEIPNHEGYDYFQHQLAAMGIIAVSVYSNQLTGNIALTETNIKRRAKLILASIEHFQSLDSGGDPIFGNRIDFSKVGLMGHSRGAEAVVVVPEILALSGVSIEGVLSLAPTDIGASSGIPAGHLFMALLPAGDGDVVSNDGAKFYDKALPTPFGFKCQLYTHKTNHNYFNRQWISDDGLGPAVMNRRDHERILSVYGCAFFRVALLDDDLVGFFTGELQPPNVAHCKVHMSSALGGQLTVDDHEDGNGIGLNSLGQPTTVTGVITANEYPFAQDAGAYNATFFGNSVGMVVETDAHAEVFRSQLSGATDLSNREIWVRASEVYNGSSIPANATGFELGVEDAASLVAWVDSDLAGGVPRPYDRRAVDLVKVGVDLTKTMLETLRFKSAYFEQAEPLIDMTKVQAILIRFNRADSRVLAFDDLQIVSV